MDNLAFDSTQLEMQPRDAPEKDKQEQQEQPQEQQRAGGPEKQDRQQWSNGMEFLMSCIAMSVGLGNVWRFPFTVYENGGGAFLVPYLVVLVLIGKPLYYMEMALGQFSSLGSVQVWELAPVFKGKRERTQTLQPSSCFSRRYTVLDEVDDAWGISRGIGSPGLALSLCLGATWVLVWAVTCCGVKSSGKAAYFLALFPYVILFMLLIRGVTLPGAVDGILFFVRPDFGRLLDPTVWYAAVTQCFFSLGVGFGSLVMMSSYNAFDHNIYKDAMIVTSMDTLTSLLAGCTIFGILGNLAYESGQSVSTVVKGGSGLAFVSYPEAIAKFEVAPQAFAVLFFLMLLTLGVGSAVALLGNLTTLCGDALMPRAPTWAVSLATCLVGALLGLVYVTPGGQYVLTLVDYYSGTFPIFVLVAAEMVVIGWVYGLDNLCRDLELMLGQRPGLYWRLTWGLITPVTMIVILVYTIATAQRLEHNGRPFPDGAV
ncbi:sodium-dependent nutrient amino acid transporter 1-like, partial [Frankliniella occidentalis]|uniref:Transporter n=1 Tax=Frankliniella occidentalis TaxID=133901 RepID=A0A9C6XV16_FRAOC